MKKVLAFTLVIVMLFSLTSCMKSGLEGDEKIYTYDNMSITLTNGFREMAYAGFTVCYDSADVAVFCIKEPFTMAEGIEDLTLEEYADLTLKANATQNPTLHEFDGIPMMKYTYHNEETDVTYAYISAMYKSGDAFWAIQFACAADVYDENEATFIKWAKSVVFS
jgi:hypothetical protein